MYTHTITTTATTTATKRKTRLRSHPLHTLFISTIMSTTTSSLVDISFVSLAFLLSLYPQFLIFLPVGATEPENPPPPFTQPKSWDHCPARAFRSDSITTFIVMKSKKGSSPSLSLTLPLKYDEEGGNLIPSERIVGQTHIQVLRKADAAQLHPECRKIWDPEILAGKVHRRTKTGMRQRKKRESFKERDLPFSKKYSVSL